MNTLFLRWSAIAFATGLFTALPGCVVTDGGYGYGYGTSVGIGLDYYEPYGAYYGGWGPGYLVAPFPGGHRPDHGGHQRPHAYRTVPGSRSIPSIPSRSRFGGP